MKFLKYYADNICPTTGIVTASDRAVFGNVFQGRAVATMCCGVYNYGYVETFNLNKGPAPKSLVDYDYLLQKEAQDDLAFANDVRKNIPQYVAGDYLSRVKVNDKASDYHWTMIDELLAKDFDRLVNPNANTIYCPEDKKLSVRDFIGEDFLEQMAMLQELSLNRITFWVE